MRFPFVSLTCILFFYSFYIFRDRVKFKNIDSTPTSLVYVEGMEIQGLVNFLLNSRSCISTTGHLAGVPPTLLAPVAFQGGTLKALKVSCLV